MIDTPNQREDIAFLGQYAQAFSLYRGFFPRFKHLLLARCIGPEAVTVLGHLLDPNPEAIDKLKDTLNLDTSVFQAFKNEWHDIEMSPEKAAELLIFLQVDFRRISESKEVFSTLGLNGQKQLIAAPREDRFRNYGSDPSIQNQYDQVAESFGIRILNKGELPAVDAVEKRMNGPFSLPSPDIFNVAMDVIAMFRLLDLRFSETPVQTQLHAALVQAAKKAYRDALELTKPKKQKLSLHTTALPSSKPPVSANGQAPKAAEKKSPEWNPAPENIAELAQYTGTLTGVVLAALNIPNRIWANAPDLQEILDPNLGLLDPTCAIKPAQEKYLSLAVSRAHSNDQNPSLSHFVQHNIIHRLAVARNKMADRIQESERSMKDAGQAILRQADARKNIKAFYAEKHGYHIPQHHLAALLKGERMNYTPQQVNELFHFLKLGPLGEKFKETWIHHHRTLDLVEGTMMEALHEASARWPRISANPQNLPAQITTWLTQKGVLKSFHGTPSSALILQPLELHPSAAQSRTGQRIAPPLTK